jgi:hypothetical protein
MLGKTISLSHRLAICVLWLAGVAEVCLERNVDGAPTPIIPKACDTTYFVHDVFCCCLVYVCVFVVRSLKASTTTREQASFVQIALLRTDVPNL